MESHSMIDKLKYVGNYQLEKTLGEGTFGKVKLGTHLLSGEKVAVKILDKERLVDPQEKERLVREIKIMKMLNNPHIVRLYEVIDTSKHMFLILEYAQGGELFDYIVAHERVKEKEARKFFRQLVSGIDYCHRKNIIHRDLKPENLLLDADMNIKIVDFGFSNMTIAGQHLHTFCGSPAYAAPEMISGREYVGPEVDLWSMGVILYALLCGYLPFDNSNIGKLYQLILKGEYETPNFLSQDSKHLIARLLTLSPEKRATLAEVRNHPWVNSGYGSPPDCHPTTHDTIDPAIMKELELIGFDPEFTLKCLKDGERNQVTATYWLLADKKRKDELKSRVLNSSTHSLSLSSITPPSPISRRAVEVAPTSPKEDLSFEASFPRSGFPEREVPNTPVDRMTPAERLPAIRDRRTPTSKPIKLLPISENHSVPPSSPSQNRRASQSNGSNFISHARQPKDKSPASIRRRRHSVQTGGLFSELEDNDNQAPLTITQSSFHATQERLHSQYHGNPPSPRARLSTPNSHGSHNRRMSLDAQSLSNAARASHEKNDLREVKGIFNVSTTSSKAGQKIIDEVKRVLDSNNIVYRENGYVLDCEDQHNLRFEVEVCRVQNVGSMSGVRLKRVSGDTWAYKRLCQKLSSEFHL